MASVQLCLHFFNSLVRRSPPKPFRIKLGLRNVQDLLYCRLCRCRSSDEYFSFIELPRDTKEPRCDDTSSTGREPNEVITSHGIISDMKLKYEILKCDKNALPVDVSTLTALQLDNLIVCALDGNKIREVEYLLAECTKCTLMPSRETLEKILCFYAANANIPMMAALRSHHLQKSHDPVTICVYDLYLAKAHWIRGDINAAFNIFTKLHRTGRMIKLRVRDVLKELIEDSVERGSGASIALIKNRLCGFAATYNDYIVLAFFWGCCWQSEFHTDQLMAEELFDECEHLRKRLTDRIPVLTLLALRDHQQDSVLRLLPILLKHDMKFEYMHSIRYLFDYKYKIDDFKGCFEIVKNCTHLNIPLGSFRQKKYFQMILRHCKEIREKEENAQTDVDIVKTFQLKL